MLSHYNVKGFQYFQVCKGASETEYCRYLWIGWSTLKSSWGAELCDFHYKRQYTQERPVRWEGGYLSHHASPVDTETQIHVSQFLLCYKIALLQEQLIYIGSRQFTQKRIECVAKGDLKNWKLLGVRRWISFHWSCRWSYRTCTCTLPLTLLTLTYLYNSYKCDWNV